MQAQQLNWRPRSLRGLDTNKSVVLGIGRRLLHRMERPLSLALLVLAAGPVAASTDGDAVSSIGVSRLDEVDALPPALGSLAFVENLGQWDTTAPFVAASGRTVVQAGKGGFVVDVLPEGAERPVSLPLSFEGARRGAGPAGVDQLPGVRNYLRGNDSGRWVRGARAFRAIVYSELYEGVDLRLRDSGGMPEYDLLLAPGADLSRVVLRCEGVSGLEVDEHGGLLMSSAHGVLRQSPPATWCVLPSGERRPLACEFTVLGATRFGFRLGERDPGLPVVVDPGLEWATYLGGSSTEWILGMGRNSMGQIVVAGTTYSPDFPTGELPFSGVTDVFVSVLDATGSTLVASTLLGGAADDWGLDVQVGAGDEVYVVGTTNSLDFPVNLALEPAFLPNPQGKFDGFVVELSPDLSQVIYASYLGGSEFDAAGALTVRAPRVLTIAGATRSIDFQAVVPGTAVQASYAGGNSDYFLCRLDLDQPPASQLAYGTYLGGSAYEGRTCCTPAELSDPQIHETGSGIVTLVGRTNSDDIVRTPFGYDASFNSTSSADEDAYIAIVDPSVSGAAALVYDSYLGADSRDAARALAVDAAGVLTVGGFTDSASFPTTTGAFETTFVDPHDGWLARLDPSQPPGPAQLVYSTLLAGDGEDNVTDLTLDSAGRVVAQGYTGAAGLAHNRFPTTCDALQPFYGGDKDGFLLWLDPAGSGEGDLLYSTLIGGALWDIRRFGLEILFESPTLRVLSAGSGGVGGVPFAIPPAAYQASSAGVEDGFVLQLEIDPSHTCVNPSSYCTAGTSTSGCAALLSAAGQASATAPSGFVLAAFDVEGLKDGLFFFGTSGRQANSWGNGTSYQCVVPPVKRAGLLTGSGTVGLCDGAFAQDLNAHWSANAAKNPGAGATVQAQLWYRDPQNTSNQTTSLSDAIEFTVAP